MLNLQDDSRDTYFIDLDGTLLIHNYDPDNFDDAPTVGAIEFLNKIKDQYIIFVTSRKEKHAMQGLRCLLKHGFMPKDSPVLMCNLPTGIRTIINDSSDKSNPKAKAVNVPRNHGLSHVE